MKKLFFALALFLLCCSMFSCSRVETPESTVEISTVADTSSSAVVLEDGVVETPYGLAYEEDLEKHDAQIATIFYWHRKEGTPDSNDYKNAEIYNNTTDILIRPIQTVYPLPNENSIWGCTITEIPEDIIIVSFLDYLNLEKQINGEWVRQCVLDITRFIVRDSAELGSSQTTLRYQLLSSTIDFRPSLVVPEIAPGQYRFIFYITVQNGEQVEPRKYAIPFEVTE